MGKQIKDMSGASIGDEFIDASAFSNSPYLKWIASKDWWRYRAVPTLIILAVWTILFYTLLSFIPVFLPAYALSLIAIAAALFCYQFGKSIRSLFEPIYSRVYKFLLKKLFAKTDSEVADIAEHLAEKRSLAQQLIDYTRYFFNLRLRENSEQSQQLKIRIAKFSTRWGSAAKLILNCFYLSTGLLLLVPMVFAVPLTPALSIGLIVMGFFGGVCSSLVVGNLFGNGLIALAKLPANSEVTGKDGQLIRPTRYARFDTLFGKLVSAAHALAGGAACFSTGMHLVMMLSSVPIVVANPLVIPVLLGAVALCSLAIARGYYALTMKVWINKAYILKGFFWGHDAEAKPVGSLQRLFGIVGAVLIGITISMAFVMLNGTSFAEIIHFPIYSLINGGIQLNLHPMAFISFVTTGVIGGIGVGVIFFTGMFKLSSDLGKWLDKRFSTSIRKSAELAYSDKEIEEAVIKCLREDYHFRAGENEGPLVKSDDPLSYAYRLHWRTERFIRAPLIILMNALATGMLATVPNVIVLVGLGVSSHIIVIVALSLLSVTAIASMGKDYLNWLPGYENPSHAYEKTKSYLYQSKLLAKQATELKDLLVTAQELKTFFPDDPIAETYAVEVVTIEAAPPAVQFGQSESNKPSLDGFWEQLRRYAADFNEINQLYKERAVITSLDQIAKIVTQVIERCEHHSVDFKKKAEALRDGYDPHLYGLLLTGIVRIVSNLLALSGMLITLFLPDQQLIIDEKKKVLEQHRHPARSPVDSSIDVNNTDRRIVVATSAPPVQEWIAVPVDLNNIAVPVDLNVAAPAALANDEDVLQVSGDPANETDPLLIDVKVG